jgi:hypothetical protein
LIEHSSTCPLTHLCGLILGPPGLSENTLLLHYRTKPELATVIKVGIITEGKINTIFYGDRRKNKSVNRMITRKYEDLPSFSSR